MKQNSFLSLIWCCLAVLIVQPFVSLGACAQEQTTNAGAGAEIKLGSQSVTNIDNNHETILSSAGLEHKNQKIALPHEYSLNNGLKIVLLEDKAYPFVSCFSWYKVGSIDDPVGMTGLTHLVEHLLFQNIGNFTGNQWANTVVRNGGEFGGFTSEDFTAFYSDLPSYQLELAIRGEAERMRSAHFAKADVVKEIDHLLKEAQTEDQDLSHVLNREVHALAFERHPYHNPPGGWTAELANLTYAQAKAHYDRYFQPSNATLVLAGGFDEQVALNLIQKYFGALPKTEISVCAHPQERPQLAERQIKLKVRGGKESIILGYKVSSVNDNDAPAVFVLEQLLGGQWRGQLRNRLLESGLCSSADIAFEQKRDPGLLVINCGGIPANASGKVIQIIDAQLSALKGQLLDDNELRQAVNQAEFAYYNDGNGPYHAAFQIGFFATLVKGETAYLWPKRINQVKAEDIQRVARCYLNEENRVLGRIAVISANQSSNNKIDYFYSKDNISTLPHAKSVLASTLSNKHYRLAGYQNGNEKPYAVALAATAPLNNASVEKEPKASVNELPKTVAPQIKFKVLRNGLRVFVFESHLKPLVQVSGAIKAGSIYEQVNNRGVAKLLTALLNCGNSKINKQQFLTQQYHLGLTPQAMLRFSTSQENILFSTNCLSKDFSDQMRLLLGCLREPRLQNADFETAKTDMCMLLKQNEKKPDTRIDRALLRSLIAPNCSYYPVYPEEEIGSIGNLKLNDLTDFYHEHVKPDSINIVVCGDVNTEEVFSLFEQLSDGWLFDLQTNVTNANSNAALTTVGGSNQTTKNSLAQGLLISNRNANKTALILPQLNPAEIVLGRIIPVNNVKQTENYWAAMLITDCALAGHPIFSRVGEQFDLNPELIEGNMSQVWDSKITKLANKLIWSMQLNLKPQSSSLAAVSAIQNALTEFSKCGLRQEEVAEAKRYLIGNIPIKDCFDLSGLTQFIFRGINELNEIEPMSRVQRIINSMKYEDINEFIARIFKPHLASIVVAGPKELTKEVHQTLPDPSKASSD